MSKNTVRQVPPSAACEIRAQEADRLSQLDAEPHQLHTELDRIEFANAQLLATAIETSTFIEECPAAKLLLNLREGLHQFEEGRGRRYIGLDLVNDTACEARLSRCVPYAKSLCGCWLEAPASKSSSNSSGEKRGIAVVVGIV